MAGIGFTLNKVIRKENLSSVVGGSVSALFIVAGPWMISILTLVIMFTLNSQNGNADLSRFTAILVYGYVVNLVIFGGVHNVFSHYLSDRIYLNRSKYAAGSLIIWFFILVTVTAAATFGIYILLPTGAAQPVAIAGGAALLYSAINGSWLCMLYLSQLRKFSAIVAVHFIGLAAQVGLSFWLSDGGTAGFLWGFALGYSLLALLLLMLSLHFKGFRIRGGELKSSAKYFRSARSLFFTGLFLNGGIWADKLLYWFTRGTNHLGDTLPLFPGYDFAVYISNLLLIPGLVVFVVFTETTLFREIQTFLLSLNRKNYEDIYQHQEKLFKVAISSIGREFLFQLAITVAFFLLLPVTSPMIFPRGVQPLTLYLAGFGSIFHLVTVTSINSLFYIEEYNKTVIPAATLLGLNVIITTIDILTPANVYPGLGYLIGNVAAALVTLKIFRIESTRLVRNILLRY